MGKRERVRKRRLQKENKKQDTRRFGKEKAAVTPLRSKNSSKNSQLSKAEAANTSEAKNTATLPTLYRRECAQDVLIVGDGDFSFSKAVTTLRKGNGGGKGVLATSYDSKSRVLAKYNEALQNITDCQSCGALVKHSVDATKLNLLKNKFDLVVFNFPHAGKQRVHLNRVLVDDFFSSVGDVLKDAKSRVHLTLKMRPPYSLWNVPEIAAGHGLRLVSTLDFEKRMFPGYKHQTTDPNAKFFEAKHCQTFVFAQRSLDSTQHDRG